MTRILGFFRVNPIIVKEIRSRMRGPRAFITLTLMLLAMGGMMYGFLQIILAGARYSNLLSPQIGQSLFAALAFLELFMICAVTPAVTAGAISGEKEKQTYEMLMATPLSPASILWGKLISAMSYVFLLLFAGVPLASVVFLFGGVAPQDMLKALLILLFTAVAYGVLGLFMSALFGRTGRATVASFVTVVVLMIGPLFAAGLASVVRNGEPPRWLLTPSPISALSAALASTISQNAGGSLFSALGGIFNMGVTPVSMSGIPRPLYHYTIPFYTLLSALLYMLSIRLVQPARRWRIGWKQALLGAGVMLALGALFVGAYFATARRYEWVKGTQTDSGALPGVRFPQGPVGGIEKRVIAVPAVADTPAPGFPTITPVAMTTPTLVGGTLHGLPTPTGTAAVNVTPVDEADEADIYAAVVRQIYTADDGGGNPPRNWNVIYVIAVPDDLTAPPTADVLKDPVNLPDSVTLEARKGFPDQDRRKWIWVDARVPVPYDPKSGLVADGQGAIFALGPVHMQPDGTARVTAGLLFASEGSLAKNYTLAIVDGAWEVTGTVK